MTRPNCRSPEAEQYRKWYKTKAWRDLRAAQLARQPLCQCPHCDAGRKKFTLATVVDHARPHKGNRLLFFSPDNLRSMAKQCHDSAKQSEERGGAGFLRGCDERGWPLSKEHEWNA